MVEYLLTHNRVCLEKMKYEDMQKIKEVTLVGFGSHICACAIYLMRDAVSVHSDISHSTLFPHIL
jgi:hypothetical protein